WVLLEGTVRPGEKLLFDGEACEVRSQSLRATTLWRESDNAVLVIPNQTFFSNTTTSYTLGDPFRRCEVMVPVPPDQNPSEIIALLERSAASIHGVLSDPSPQALLLKIGDATSLVSSIYALRFMIGDPINQPKISSAVQSAIWQILSAKGLASLKAEQAPLGVDPSVLGITASHQTTAPNQ
ncbi:MAG: mechanosensitive ion channel, partial [Cyanobacteria bacterium]|nr:mechanosensitive ion channel [Cyanobacteriota bacterium]